MSPTAMRDVSSGSSDNTPSDAQSTGSPVSTTLSTEQFLSDAEPQGSFSPIAIVGIGLRLPGGVRTTDAFWGSLLNRQSFRSEVPGSRYNVDAYHSTSGRPGTVKSRHGYFLDEDISSMDAAFFSMSKAEVERLDPQQRLLLEVVWECMESAGQKDWRGRKIGCYVGVFGEDWLDLNAKDPQHTGMYRITGTADFALANRISYEFDMKGPSMTIETGCSSSLVGLHEACAAIHAGACESAVVAGTNLLLSPTMTLALSEQGVLSPSGMCQSFDAKADGYVRGEAVNAVFVKKLEDAIRDGDPVRAIIRGTATNFDGKTPGISNPSSESHEALIRHAYSAAGIDDFTTTAFVECHGTGTPAGDPIETTAVGRVFGEKGVYIGSVKPNVGHSEGASGLTSLIKTVLALENSTIPPQANFADPNPKINNFGIGGANALVVVDSAASLVHSRPPLPPPVTEIARGRHHLLPVSGHHPDSVKQIISNITEYARKYPFRLGDLAYTLGSRRKAHPYRTFAVVDGGADDVDLQFAPTARVKADTSTVNFLFTGQGAQWAGMGLELLQDFPDFLASIRAMDRALQALPHPPSWTMEDELQRPDGESRINEPEFSQPICTALQIGLVNLLYMVGIQPAAVVGHSSGEIAAAYAAGVLSQDAAITIAYYRGQVTKKQLRKGGMAAVGLGKEEVTPYLGAGSSSAGGVVGVACVNSPNSVTLSGDVEALDAAIASIKSALPDCFVRRLKVDKAYHSHHMEEIGDNYEQLIAPFVSPASPTVPLFSSVTAKRINSAAQLGASYWRSNLEKPVLFSSAVRSMLQAENSSGSSRALLEVGPHSALAGPVRDILKSLSSEIGGSAPPYMSSLTRKQHASRSFMAALGQLYQASAPVDLASASRLHDHDQASCTPTVLADLPPYPWRHDATYWNESRIAHSWRQRKFPPHELLGVRTMDADDLEPAWRNMLRLDDAAWLRDHKIHNDVVFPAAGYVSMIGEAVRQMHSEGIPVVDFSLRQVDIRTALVLREDETKELLTRMRKVRLTTSLDSSAWYEFSISSYNGETWVKHCTGQARASSDAVVQGEPELGEEHPRPVPSPAAWYRTMKAVGLNYGPHFQGLTNISAASTAMTNLTQKKAAATIRDRSHDEQRGMAETRYQIHPTAIDFCLQTFMVGTAEGLSRKLKNLRMPTYIDHLYIRRGSATMRVGVSVDTTPGGVVRGTVTAVSDGQVVLWMRGVELSPLGDASAASEGGSASSDGVAAAQLVWKPDLDFVDPGELISSHGRVRDACTKVERLSLLCSLETLRRVQDLPVSHSLAHLEKFRNWLLAQRKRAIAGTYDHVPDAPALAALDANDLKTEISAAMEAVERTSGSEVGKVMMRSVEFAEAIFKGEIDSIEVLIQDSGLENVYVYMQSLCEYERYFELLGHSNPCIRILEIGAGTGGTTEGVLKGLTRPGSNRQPLRRYSQYDYTDVSVGFFGNAQERFKNYENMHYRVLDITREPAGQGFEEGSYDLILASNVLHATPSLKATLTNVRRLLRPGGKLFLQELSPVWRAINYIMGFLPGWWLGELDGRPDEPYVVPSRWDVELRSTGFSGVDAAIFDDETPYHLNANIIATAVSESPANEFSQARRVSLLCTIQDSSMVTQLHSTLSEQGLDVTFTSFDEVPKEDCCIISLLDLEAPFFYHMTSEKLSKLQQYLGQISPSTSVLTIRSELAIAFATLELDLSRLPLRLYVETIINVCTKFDQARRHNGSGELDPDWEYASIDGQVLIPRYNWIDVSQDMVGTPVEDKVSSTSSLTESILELTVGRPGQLQSLAWVAGREVPPLGPDEVDVEPRAIGLNFKDVLVAMGIVQGLKPGLGLECAGVIRRVGSEVRGLTVGDRVVSFDHGFFASRVTTSSKLVAKIPDNLTFEEAATMPCVYSTAMHALVKVGGVQPGQSVLIHSACGGVGIAAINICKMKGAEIFVTVGQPEKAHYLMKEFGIRQDHIFHSRDSSFHTDLMEATGGRGVDLVVNSLSGELLHTSWKCVADFGKMLEIGKRDFIGRGQLAMDVFEANRMFVGIDMSQMAIDRPGMFQRILEDCMSCYSQGLIEPIRPVKIFPASEVVDAFRHMQKGQHIGKIVVTMPNGDQNSSNLPRALPLPIGHPIQPIKFSAESSYLLVGGLGGLGRAVSTWMIENGARNVVYLSRSGGESPQDQAFVNELLSQGCQAQVFKGDAASLSDVENAIRKSNKPVAGVMLMSMVLQDRAFLKLTLNDWQAAVVPKIDAAWAVHNALESTKTSLDFMVLYSSLSAVMGQIGQANYASANTFLAAFAQYRHALGLPASVLDIGVMEDVGYVSENPAILEQFRSLGYHTLKEEDLLDALTFSIRNQMPRASDGLQRLNSTEMAIGLGSLQPVSDPSTRVLWKRDRRMAIAHLDQSSSSGLDSARSTPGNQDIAALVSKVATQPQLIEQDETQEFLTRQIGIRLYAFMFRPEEDLDVNQSLTALGIDSLVAIEIRNWWRQTFGLELSVLEIMSASSIRALGKLAVDGLRKEYSANTGTTEVGE
ncbi:56kDa selenium binding protein (SBP56) [Purpureocillium lavendulum]|uniref:56kDa selenium binding protein (SBP56) n=1 Tax=Purpureocillium lavendulum TaxID=1247861 RepID=A0AB34FQ17_9HYPO|nr:56kDa selenium binding protein (SBP56) [Purpureocillium lavendulum]